MSVNKSTVAEIRARFDAEVERFSDLETGQLAAMDSPLHLELLTQAAVGVTPDARAVLDRFVIGTISWWLGRLGWGSPPWR